MPSREFAFPNTRKRFAADRVVDIEHLALVIDVDPALRTVAGTATLRARGLAAGARAIELDAVDLAIDKVILDGAPAPFRHDGKKLRVELASALAVGSQLDLAITYRGAPRRGLYFIAPDDGYPTKPVQVWSQGQDEDSRHWFPCFDSPHEKATTEVTVTVPAPLFALSNGTLVSDRTSGGKRTLHWRLDVPHSCYLVTLAVGDFVAIETTWRDTPVVYYVQRGREANAERTLARTPAMLELFSNRFGVPYPYPRYAQVFVADFIFGGMENTSATTLTDTILLDERASLDYDVDALISHELAHQWFGDLVTCRDWGEGWLNEGFATYSEYLWREAHEGRDAADLEMDDWGDAYMGEDGNRYRRTIATKLYEEPIDIFDHHLYEKGGRVLHMLRDLLGDGAFFASLAHYLGKHRHGVVESRDLARAVEDATGRVVDWFFSQWVIDGAGHPELDVKIAWDAATSLASVTVEQTQKVDAVTPLFRDADADAVPGRRRRRRHPRSSCATRATCSTSSSPASRRRRCSTPAASCSRRSPPTSPSRCGSTSSRARRWRSIARRRRRCSAGAAVRPPSTRWSRRSPATSSGRCAAPRHAALAGLRRDRGRDALVERLARRDPPAARAARSPATALGDFVGDTARRATRSHAPWSRSGLTPATSSRPRRASPSVARARRGPASCSARPPRASRSPMSFASTRIAGSPRRATTARSRCSSTVCAGAGRPRAAGPRPAGARDASWCAAAATARRATSGSASSCCSPTRTSRVQAAARRGAVGDRRARRDRRAAQDGRPRARHGRLRRRGREVIRDLGEAAPHAEELRRLRDEVGELRSLAGRLRERLDLLEGKNGEVSVGAEDKEKKRDKDKDKRDKKGKKKR